MRLQLVYISVATEVHWSSLSRNKKLGPTPHAMIISKPKHREWNYNEASKLQRCVGSYNVSNKPKGYRHQSCINSTHHKALHSGMKELVKIMRNVNWNPSDSELDHDLVVLVTRRSFLWLASCTIYGRLETNLLLQTQHRSVSVAYCGNTIL